MSPSGTRQRELVSLSGAMGALGGAVLVLSNMYLTPGKYILTPFALVVVGITLAVRAEKVESFWARFFVCLSSFSVAALALYVSIILSPRIAAIPFQGHGVRIAALIVIGASISLATARLSRAGDRIASLNDA